METVFKFDALSPVKPLALPTDEIELKREVLRLRDELLGLRSRLAEAEVVIKRMMDTETLESSITPEEHVEYLKGVVKDLEFRLETTRSSTTWRVGRLMLAPTWPVRRLFGRK